MITELPPALAPLGNYNQFIIWKPVPAPDGRTEKKPVNPHTGAVHDPHDPSIWMDPTSAIASANKYPNHGIGFVFADSDPFWFLDIDKCRPPDGGWNQIAVDMCNRFAGCAVEVSHSGTGLHIFGTGTPPEHGSKYKALNLEFYHRKRFVALTGNGAQGDASAMAPVGALEWLVNNYFPPSSISINPDDWRDTPIDAWSGPDDDDELIARMLASKSAGASFGGKASIAALWDADEQILGANYPDQADRPYDASSADAALCAHLAWWTGHNCDRMDRLFRRSKLYREKWEKRADYRQKTVLKAVAGCSGCYSAPEVVAPTSTAITGEPATPVMKSGFQYMAPDQQLAYFAGCVYIQVLHRIFTPNGMMLKPEQFKAMYGGWVFALDSSNDKTTKSAWEVFTESQAINFPKATNIVFRPEQPPGALIKEEGLILLNNYIPIEIDREIGDPAPFLGLLQKLFPHERDRQIILAYMAACVQYPGKKFHWAPLIQGCEGNGKSLLLTAVSRAVGVRYTHKPPARDISNVFNAWITGRLFIAVEEVYVHDNREVMDALKTLITDDRVPVTPKGVDQITGDNRANFMCTSNHKNAIRIARKNNRRWGIFYTPQQDEDDLVRDGMGGNYFPRLYDWFNARGCAIIAEYLATYKIPVEFDPSGAMHRAPTTTSTEEAASATLGAIEQDILEAVGEGRPGFANGWISSMQMAVLLNNKRISHNKRQEILTELGYILHPGLNDGRVNTIIPFDGGKPRLYIKYDHPHASLTNGPEIIKQYILAQGT